MTTFTCQFLQLLKSFRIQLIPLKLECQLYTFIWSFIKFFNSIALETIEKLSSSLDFSDYCSQIIHAVVDVLGIVLVSYSCHFPFISDTSSELRGVAMEVLCSMMIQLGPRYKIFIQMVKKVSTYNSIKKIIIHLHVPAFRF